MSRSCWRWCGRAARASLPARRRRRARPMGNASNLVNGALLVAASIAYTLGGVCMKYSEGLTKVRPTALLFLLFVGGAALQALAMKNSEMAVTYIFVLGLESILAFVLGVVVF